MVYICSFCQAHYDQPLARVVEKKNDRTGSVTNLFKTQAGPPVGDKCPECESALHVRPHVHVSFAAQLIYASQVAGPMWNGAIHKPEFVGKVLKHLEENEDKYGTAARMKGMLTVAKEVRIHAVARYGHGPRHLRAPTGTPHAVLLYARAHVEPLSRDVPEPRRDSVRRSRSVRNRAVGDASTGAGPRCSTETTRSRARTRSLAR
jgi:hypothetical protein